MDNNETPPVETQAVPELTAHQSNGIKLSKPMMAIACLVVILLLVLVNGGFSHGENPARSRQ